MKYYAKKWTAGRGTQWANTGADVAEYYTDLKIGAEYENETIIG